MTDQELFTKVATHLLTQNERSGAVGDCRYRAGDLSCAAGCLIADEHYASYLETFAVHNWAVRDALVSSGVAPEQITLVKALQVLHDTFIPRVWPQKLQDLANKRGFSFTPLGA